MKSIKIKNLNDTEKHLLIAEFYKLYYNTDQNENLFCKEFYSVTGEILNDFVPVKLKFLTDFQNDLLKVVPRIKDFLI